MALRLSIISRQGPKLGTRRTMEFGPDGGTIGRSLECDWALSDAKRYLSSRHASIDFRSGSYYIVDTSMNGVYVNDAEQPVGRGKPQRLFSGDRLRFGEYEISVEVEEDPATLIDENHVDPVDLAQRVDAPEPTGNDLVDAYEITGVGIEMLLTDDELETLSPPPKSKGAYFEIVDDDAAKTRVPSDAARSAGTRPAPKPAQTPTPKPAQTPTPKPAQKPAPKPAPVRKSATPQPQASAPEAVAAPKPAAAPGAVSAPKPAAAPGAVSATKRAAAPGAVSAPKPAAAPAGSPATKPEAAPGTISAQNSASAAQASPLPRAPAAPSAAAILGLELNGAAPTRPQPHPTPLHASRAPDLEPFFRGARMSSRVPPQQVDAFLFRLGQIMRAMIVGITEGLHLRAEQKNALRLPSTTIQPQDNNPLKLSAGVEEAFANLLLRDSSAHLPPVDAVREAFDDMQLHQQLMLKAARSALDAFVARLDPDELEQKFAHGRTNVLMNAANRLKYWDLYKDLYDVVAHHPPGELPLQFLDDFGEAYGRELELARAAAAEERQAG